jgi:hypothetical protein
MDIKFSKSGLRGIQDGIKAKLKIQRGEFTNFLIKILRMAFKLKFRGKRHMGQSTWRWLSLVLEMEDEGQINETEGFSSIRLQEMETLLQEEKEKIF